jgi:hypothetical protein
MVRLLVGNMGKVVWVGSVAGVMKFGRALPWGYFQ